jgi:hypothetical protein
MVVARRKVKFMLPDDLAKVLDEKSMHIRELDKEGPSFAPPRTDDEDIPKKKTPNPKKEFLQGKVHSKKGELSELAMSKFGEASCTSSFGESCTDLSFNMYDDDDEDDDDEKEDWDEFYLSDGSGEDEEDGLSESDSRSVRSLTLTGPKQSPPAFDPNASSLGYLDLSDSDLTDSPTGVASFPSQGNEDDWGNDSGVDLLVPKIRSQSLVASPPTRNKDVKSSLGAGSAMQPPIVQQCS